MIHVCGIDKTIFVGFFMEVTSLFERTTKFEKDIARFKIFEMLPNVIYGACNIILCFQMYHLSTLSYQIEAPGEN